MVEGPVGLVGNFMPLPFGSEAAVRRLSVNLEAVLGPGPKASGSGTGPHPFQPTNASRIWGWLLEFHTGEKNMNVIPM